MLEKLESTYYSCAALYCEDGKKMQSDEFGKKIFKGVHFIYNSEKVYKTVQ